MDLRIFAADVFKKINQPPPLTAHRSPLNQNVYKTPAAYTLDAAAAIGVSTDAVA